MIYILLSFMFLYLILNFEKLKKKYIYHLIEIIIMFFLGCRYIMGTDWVQYQKFYEMSLVNLKHSFEIGFVYLNYIFSNLGFSYEIFQGIIIIMYVRIVFKMFKNHFKINVYLSIYIYLCLAMVTTCFEPLLRQIIAISIYISSFKYIEEKKMIRYFILIIFATLFHNSAYILLPLYFIYNIKIKEKNIIMIFGGILLIINIIDTVVLKIINLVPQLSSYKEYIYSQRYGFITDLDLKRQLVTLVLVAIYIYFILQDNYSSTSKRYIKNMAFLYVVIYTFSSRLPILHRLTYYFVPGFVLSISAGISYNIKSRKYSFEKKIKIIFLYLLFSLYIFRAFTSTELNKYRYKNYKNFFIEYLNGNIKKSDKKKEKYLEEIRLLLRMEKIKNGK